jgi:RNA polymerase sigma factor (sigma-70 family)
MMIEDEWLKWRFRHGSRAALARIYEKYVHLLLSVAVGLLNDPHEAEDVVQDVFVSFARSANGFGLRGSLKAYLATCVANRARDRIRSERLRLRRAGANTTTAMEADGPDHCLVCSERCERLSRALAELPYEQREVVVLAAHEQPQKTPSATMPVTIRRTFMRSPMVKLGIAAVVIAVAGIGMLEFVGSGPKSGVAWAQVLAKTERVAAVTFDMAVEITYTQDRKIVLPSKNYIAGEYGSRSDIFYEGKLSQIQLILPKKKVAYRIRADQKRYWRLDLPEQEAGADRNDPRTWLKAILSSEYTKLGCMTINGIVTEGIECRSGFTGRDGVMRLWVAVETNLPVRIEAEGLGLEGGKMRPHRYVMENFEWSAKVDETLFEPNIPEDYTLAEEPKVDQTRPKNPNDHSQPRSEPLSRPKRPGWK